MNELLEYFNELNDLDYFKKKIRVYGYKKSYNYNFVEGLTPYLFESLNIKNKIAKETNENRPGKIEEKKYITIHDTGDTLPGHGSKFWADAVYNEFIKETNQKYACSYQYVVGNEGIYHMIPDNEIAWHAGDSTKVSYNLYDTGVGIHHHHDIDITTDGYFSIGGIKSNIMAPRGENDKILTKDDINDQGLTLVKGENNYLLGEVYYNETYQKICNRGGNNNSIGIEISMAKGENLFVNLARCAKLVVKLLKENKLLMSDIKQHHFFSGKNCPQTLRENELWDYFLHLIDVEAIVDSYLSDGYKLSIETKCEYVNENGSIDKLPGAVRGIEYIVTTEYQGKKETALFVKLI